MLQNDILFPTSEVPALVLHVLENGSLSTVTIIKQVSLLRPGTTRQAVYHAMRELKKQNYITVANKIVSISDYYINLLLTFCKHTSKNKRVGTYSLIESIPEGGSIKFNFSDYNILDQFTSDFELQVVDTLEKHRAILWLQSHEIFLIGRHKMEIELLESFSKKNITLCVVNNAKTDLDLFIKKNYFNTKNLQLSFTTEKSIPLHYYAAIIDDYILEVWLDKKFIRELHTLFVENKTITPAVISTAENLFSQKFKARMKISKNNKRATAIYKKYSKLFYLPVETK